MRQPLRQPRLRAPSRRLLAEIANTRFERILGNASQLALVVMGIIALLFVIHIGQYILAPVFLAITVGLMFGPVADMLERRGIPDAASAGIVVLGFLLILFGGGFLFSAPLAEWVGKAPEIWQKLQTELADWREPIAAIAGLQEQVSGIFGNSNSMSVTVEDGSAVTSIALLAPAIVGQMLIFLLSLYFFLATRDNIRISTLSLCVTRRMRWRVAHVFRDVEQKVSTYLLTIALVAAGVGVIMATATFFLGMPSPLLWGAMAAVLNFIPFVGQALMALILFVVGLGTFGDLGQAMIPVVIYWIVNFLEGNFVSPNLLGRTMTINPFMIFLALTFWIWVWGPVGGLIAVPSLLVVYSVLTHILPVHMPSQKSKQAIETAARTAEDVRETRAAVAKSAPRAGSEDEQATKAPRKSTIAPKAAT